MDGEEYLQRAREMMMEQLAASTLVSRAPPANGFWARLTGVALREAIESRIAREGDPEQAAFYTTVARNIPDDASYVLTLYELESMLRPTLRMFLGAAPATAPSFPPGLPPGPMASENKDLENETKGDE
jgi:hypothetical protein